MVHAINGYRPNGFTSIKAHVEFALICFEFFKTDLVIKSTSQINCDHIKLYNRFALKTIIVWFKISIKINV